MSLSRITRDRSKSANWVKPWPSILPLVETVADDWLIDHESPTRYETLLTQKGITFEKGKPVEVVNTQTGEVDTTELEDALNFDAEAFNRRVINENFNRVICEQLVQELDPFGDEKTMIFCASDLHADKALGAQPDTVLDELNEGMWPERGA